MNQSHTADDRVDLMVVAYNKAITDEANTAFAATEGKANRRAMRAALTALKRATPAPDYREALSEAALFLQLGAVYAPDEAIDDLNRATGERFKTRSLRTVMREVAKTCSALAAQSVIADERHNTTSE